MSWSTDHDAISPIHPTPAPRRFLAGPSRLPFGFTYDQASHFDSDKEPSALTMSRTPALSAVVASHSVQALPTSFERGREKLWIESTAGISAECPVKTKNMPARVDLWAERRRVALVGHWFRSGIAHQNEHGRLENTLSDWEALHICYQELEERREEYISLLNEKLAARHAQLTLPETEEALKTYFSVNPLRSSRLILPKLPPPTSKVTDTLLPARLHTLHDAENIPTRPETRRVETQTAREIAQRPRLRHFEEFQALEMDENEKSEETSWLLDEAIVFDNESDSDDEEYFNPLSFTTPTATPSSSSAATPEPSTPHSG